MLGTLNLSDDSTPVQSHWNSLEYLLIKATDALAPLENFNTQRNYKSNSALYGIKNVINRHKRLLKIDKINKTTLNLPSIKLLSREISNYFSRQRIGNVKRAATGPNGNLWRAVKRAKNIVQDEIPSNLTLGGKVVAPDICYVFLSRATVIILV